MENEEGGGGGDEGMVRGGVLWEYYW